MADSLVLKGVKDVVKHKGSEMLLTRPKRGGDSHLLAKWWSVNPVNTVYVTCSVFKVTDGGNSCYLAIETSEKSQVRIDHAGAFEFNFYGVSQIGRGALYNDAMELIEHYAFPKVSGGKIMTITPAGAAAKPGGGPPPAPDPAIGNVTIAGDTTASDGEDKDYVVSNDGDAADSFSLTSTEGGDVITGTSPNFNVVYNGDGARTLTATASLVDATDNGATGTLAINIARNLVVAAAAADVTHVVTVANGEYEIDGVANAEVTANANETIYFDLSDASVSGHPFAIYTDSTKTTTVTVGVETSADGTILLFTPPIAGSFSYQCTQHADMGGDITVS